MFGQGGAKKMSSRQPTVFATRDALVVRIPWDSLDLREPQITRRKRRLTIRDVSELVEAGRLAHRLGKTRSVRSLKELIP